MKVIFLDIDGVLNSTRSSIAFAEPLRTKMDPVAVQLLYKVQSRSNAKIVISSTWRLWEDWLTCIWGCMREAGWPASGSKEMPIIDRTPIFNKGPRGAEIKTWLDTKGIGVKSYIILDDDSDMLPEQLPFFVQTDGDVGLGFKEWQQIVRLWPVIEQSGS